MPSTHTFRNPDLYGLTEIRELYRGHRGADFPSGPRGFVVEDLDLILRWYGQHFGLDNIGRLRLVEVKYRPDLSVSIGRAQAMTFRMLDLMVSHPTRYDGFHIVAHDTPTIEEATRFSVCGSVKTLGEFRDWSLDPRAGEACDHERPG